MKRFYVALFLIVGLAGFTLGQPTQAEENKPFLMAVEDAFYITGRGMVATGKIERGKVKPGDTVELVGIRPAKTVTVTAIEAARKVLDEGKAGDNVGLLLRGINKDEVERGQVLAKPGTMVGVTSIKAVVDLLPSHEGGRSTPLNNGYRGLIYLRTAAFSGTFSFSDKESFLPGATTVPVEIKFEKTVPVEKGQIFAIREYNRTIGSGKITALIP